MKPGTDAEPDPLGATAVDANDVSDATTAVPPTASSNAPNETKGASISSRRDQNRPPGVTIGRFVVVEKLGRGGMGVVYAAYDPQLDRKVAIKMLHDNLSKDQGARLEREARAMAQLSHPNVVTVHETGTWDGRLYIAMEYVVGQTFGAWLRAAPRTLEQVVVLLLQAGRGLAAAHAVGLVHRDFKPDNVLVGADGRVRVSDFGLVTTSGETVTSVGGRSPAVLSPSSLTVTGAVMGTPLYMAPEQHDGRVADAKADQFSFCVTLWQALCDEPPYGSNTYEDLVANVSGGKLRPVPRGVRVPTNLRMILARGLAPNPDDRFPSMQALLAAIERTQHRRRIWPWLIPATAIVAGASVAAVFALRGGSAPDPCTGSSARLTGVWDTPRKAKLAAVFAAVPSGADVWPQVAGTIDRYTGLWVSRHEQVCRATARGEQSAEALDLRMRCYDGRLADLDVLLGRFGETADRAAMFKTLDASAGLPSFVDCDDTDRLRAAIPLPGDAGQRLRLVELERRFAEAVSFDKMGRHARAREIVTPLVSEIRQLGYPPLEAKAVLLRAGEEYRAGDLAIAEQSYRDAAQAAARARDDGRIAQSWIDLMSLLAAQGRYDAALELVTIARTSAERVSDQPRLGARFANALGGIYGAQGKRAEAKAEYERALELVRKDGRDSELLGPALLNLGTSLWQLGDTKGAYQYFEDARLRFEVKLGPRHPTLGYVHRNLGDLSAGTDVDGAITHYLLAQSIFEGAHGPDHIDVAIALEPLSYAYARKRDAVNALAAAQRALALREAKLGPSHASLALTLTYLATAEVLGGKPAALEHAQQHLTRALAIQEAALGKENAQLVSTLEQLGEVATAMRKHEVALAHALRGLAINVKAYGAHHNTTAYSQLRVAEAELALSRYDAAFHDFGIALAVFDAADPKDPDVAKVIGRKADVRARQHRDAEALALYTTALARADAANAMPPGLRAEITFGRARALWATGDRAGGVALASETRATSTDAALRTAIDTWLAKHGR